MALAQMNMMTCAMGMTKEFWQQNVARRGRGGVREGGERERK
jgi:hypothetical protein